MFAPIRLTTIVMAGMMVMGRASNPVRSVSAGDGNSFGPVAAADSFVSVHSGGTHSCALTARGEAFCWGGNNFGQTGASSSDTCTQRNEKGKENQIPCALRPGAVRGGLRFESLALGQLHSCGMTPEGTAYCWGDNTLGQLGVDSVPSTCTEDGMTLPCSHVPVAVGGELHFSALTAGRFHTCGITTDGLVYCWGNHTTGQLGTAGPFENCGLLLRSSEPMPCNHDPAPITADLRATRVTAGALHTCAIATDNTAHCWGHGFQAIPTPIPEGRQFVSVDAGGLMTCALANDQIPWCWGSFYHPFTHFQISGTHPSKGGFWSDKTPDHHFTSLTVGSGHICGLAVGGQAFCWGRGTEGQLGSSQRLGRLLSDERWTAEPVPVEGNLRFTSLSAGDGHTCGTTSSGRAYCWGNNELGQLGDGSTSKRDTPAAVLESAIAMRWP